MRPRLLVALLLTGCAGGTAPASRAAGNSVIRIDAPSVVAVYAVPPEGLLNSDDNLASLMDEYMYYWAEAAPRLDSLGMRAEAQPLAWEERRFQVRTGGRCWSARLPGEVGYLLAAPGKPPRLIVGKLFDEELADSARIYLRAPLGTGMQTCP